MPEAFANLPSWALFALGVVYLAFQFAKWFVSRRTETQRTEAVREYVRRTRPDDLGDAQDLRLLLEQDRATQESLSLAREGRDAMARIEGAMAEQTVLLARLAEMLEQQQRSQAEIAEALRDVAHEVTDWRRRTQLRTIDGRAVEG